MPNAKRAPRTKRPALPPAHDWRARDLADWNATTFAAYLAERHEGMFGIKYVAGNSVARERAMLKRMIDEYGPDVTKRFIDACLAEYKPTTQYPGVSFTFMYSFMRARVLPRVLAEVQRARQAAAATTGLTEEQADEIIGLL
jgi:glycine cleavage system protein P-like pyridoxal-binding family